MITINDVKVGSVIVFNGDPFEILFCQHSKTGRAGAVLRTKLKNLKNGSIINHTFQGGDSLEEAELDFRKAQFLYKENDTYVFMDNGNYEQFELPDKVLDSKGIFLKEGSEVSLIYFDNSPISVKFPIKMEFEVIDAPPSIKGNTANGGTKQVTIETGAKISTPLFIEKGDKIRINIEKGEYCERA